MRIHMTNLYGMVGPGVRFQHNTMKIAKELGFNELGLYRYNVDVDTDEELGKRIDGIISSVSPGDIVFMQSPSWNKIRYDLRFVRKLKAYSNLKLVFFIHDVIPLMYDSSEENLREMIEVYNYADLIIVASERLRELLCKYGLKVKKQMIQVLCDYPFSDVLGMPLEGHATNVEVKGQKSELEYLFGLSEGGYGLVWESKEANDYYKMLQPYKVATYLAAGIPIIVQKGLVSEEIILKNKVGFVVETLEEADAIVQNTTEAEYNEMVKRIAQFNFLIKNGWFTRKLLIDAVTWLLDDNYKSDASKTFEYNVQNSIQVRGIHDSLDYILKNSCSVARFGDGEMDLISGRSIPYQKYDASLASYLRTIMGMNSTEKMLICLPDVFEKQERYNEYCTSFWTAHLDHYETYYKEICCADWYGSTFISRPYIDLKDKSESAGYFEHLKLLWENRDILIVEGSTSRVGVGNDLFNKAKSIQRIICPSKDAWFQYGEILGSVMKHAENRLILIMLGPTAKVLAYELAMRGFQAIDLGHIDSEYEWFCMGADHKVKLSNKHTAEHNYDENIVFNEDSEYTSQIVYSCIK